MIVVSDASSLIAISSVGRLELLRELYGEVLVPEAVWDEVVTPGRAGTPALLSARWISRRGVRDEQSVERLLSAVGKGEAERWSSPRRRALICC